MQDKIVIRFSKIYTVIFTVLLVLALLLFGYILLQGDTELDFVCGIILIIVCLGFTNSFRSRTEISNGDCSICSLFEERHFDAREVVSINLYAVQKTNRKVIKQVDLRNARGESLLTLRGTDAKMDQIIRLFLARKTKMYVKSGAEIYRPYFSQICGNIYNPYVQPENVIYTNAKAGTSAVYPQAPAMLQPSGVQVPNMQSAAYVQASNMAVQPAAYVQASNMQSAAYAQAPNMAVQPAAYVQASNMQRAAYAQAPNMAMQPAAQNSVQMSSTFAGPSQASFISPVYKAVPPVNQ